MAYLTTWNITDLPSEMVDILERDIEQFDDWQDDSRVMGNEVAPKIRNSKNAWISTDHWIAGWIWYYIQKANRENFLYDLSHIDGENMQYTRYEKGEYYNWHNDSGLSIHFKPKFNGGVEGAPINNKDAHLDYLNKQTEYVRKLSFTLQLSDPDDYEGGNVELINEANQNYIAPRQRGSIILFDSRTQHRVNKITKGIRRSIVGWVVGPRWK